MLHRVKDTTVELLLLALEDRHLKQVFAEGTKAGGYQRESLVNGFFAIGLLTLLMACINFVNLSSARMMKRSREVAIRKVAGAGSRTVLLQNGFELFLQIALSATVSLALSYLSFPFLEQLIETPLTLPFVRPGFWMYFISLTFVIGIVCAFYPAYLASNYTPLSIPGKANAGRKSILLRRTLVTVQFCIATLIIAATLIIQQQLSYAQERQTGYNNNRLVYHSISPRLDKNFDGLARRLVDEGLAESVSKTFAPITNPDAMGNGYTWQGWSQSGSSSTLFVSFATTGNLVQTLGLKLVEGREIDLYIHPSDSDAVVVNESALKVMNMDDPLGKWIEHNGRRMFIVGVVRNFILESPFDRIRPLIIRGPYQEMRTMHIKFSEGPIETALDRLKGILADMDRELPFDLRFVDSEYDALFRGERKVRDLSLALTLVAGSIAVLGLLGLMAYLVEQKRKELGIRKVLGASLLSIAYLLSKDFVKPFCIAMLIACPVAFLLMQQWLLQFDYRTQLSWLTFIPIVLTALFIAFSAISYQIFRAARANPVENLRED